MHQATIRVHSQKLLFLQGNLPGNALGPFSEGAADLGGELWEAALQEPCTGHCR